MRHVSGQKIVLLLLNFNIKELAFSTYRSYGIPLKLTSIALLCSITRRLPGRRALVLVFIKNMLFEIIAFVVFECPLKNRILNVTG